MITYERVENFLTTTGYTEDQLCAILNMSRQNLYNIKRKDTSYHKFLRDIMELVVNVPEVLEHILKEYPERFDTISGKLTRLYVKEVKRK